MADLTRTPSLVRFMEGIEARMIPMIADEAISVGQPVYRKANGRAGVARANATGTSKVVGIATKSVIAGKAFEAGYHARFVGFDLSSVNPGTTVYLSVTATGVIADAAATGTGNVVVPLGTVHTMTDVSATRFIFFDIPLNAPTPTALT